MQDFCLSSRLRNRRIAGYATISITQKTDKKTRKMGGLLVASCLSQLLKFFFECEKYMERAQNKLGTPLRWRSSLFVFKAYK